MLSMLRVILKKIMKNMCEKLSNVKQILTK